jgi:predicted esterase
MRKISLLIVTVTTDGLPSPAGDGPHRVLHHGSGGDDMKNLQVSSVNFSKRTWAALNDDNQEFTILRANWDGITGDVVAVVWDDDDAEEKRIAQVLSAAPEMLEALKAAREELRLLRMKDTDAVYNPVLGIQMDIAINKATGQ